MSSSNCATHGSINDSTQNFPGSDSSTSNSSSSVADQQALSNSRIAAYVADLAASYIQYRRQSVHNVVSSHTINMKLYLDEFDTTMARYEK